MITLKTFIKFAFNIGGLTTVTIESLIFKKQIFLCYDER